MNINYELIKDKMNQRKAKIEQFATAKNISPVEASIYIDWNAPSTTNRNMLAEVGFVVNDVTEDNFSDVIDALKAINVFVINYENKSTNVICNSLNAAINEDIPECWGGPDLQEFIDLGGATCDN